MPGNPRGVCFFQTPCVPLTMPSVFVVWWKKLGRGGGEGEARKSLSAAAAMRLGEGNGHWGLIGDPSKECPAPFYTLRPSI